MGGKCYPFGVWHPYGCSKMLTFYEREIRLRRVKFVLRTSEIRLRRVKERNPIGFLI